MMGQIGWMKTLSSISGVLAFLVVLAGLIVAAVAYFKGKSRVALLGEGPRRAGERVVAWDGRDPRGHRLPSGVYLARLAVEGEVYVRKIVLAR